MMRYILAGLLVTFLVGCRASEASSENQATGNAEEQTVVPGSSPGSVSQPSKPEFRTQETLLVSVPLRVGLKLSGDALHIAYVDTSGDKSSLAVDGRQGPAWTKILYHAISDDGQHVAYLALDGQSYVLVVDGQATEKFELIESVRFHARTGRVLCIARNGQKHYLLVDGKTLGPYDNVSPGGFSESGTAYAAVVIRRPNMHYLVNGREGEAFQSFSTQVIFSPDGNRFGYVAWRKGGRQIVVIDGKVRAEYQPPAFRGDKGRKEPEIIFSPDSKRVAYRVYRPDGQWAMNVDGREFAGGTFVGLFVFSPDSKHFAYVVGGKGGHTLILDGQQRGAYEYIAGLQFSPDSQHTSFVAIKGGQRLVVWDDKEGPGFTFRSHISNVRFSPDSRRIMYNAGEDRKIFIVADMEKTGPFEVVSSQVFSPDSRHYACTVQRGDRWLHVIDGKEGKSYEATWEVAFSPKGDRYAYVARQGKEYFVVRQDGSESPRYDVVAHPVFAPDGRLVYRATKGEQRRVVVDGLEGADFEGIQNVRFTPQGHLVYQGLRRGYGRGWFLVIERQEYGPYQSHLPYAVGADGSINYVARKSDKWYRVQHVPVK